MSNMESEPFPLEVFVSSSHINGSPDHHAGRRSPKPGDNEPVLKDTEDTENTENTESTNDTSWMEHGNCRELDHAIMFPVDGKGVENAKVVCVDCPVIKPCLEYALRHRIDHGVWGGAGERERKRIRKDRKAEANLASTAMNHEQDQSIT